MDDPERTDSQEYTWTAALVLFAVTPTGISGIMASAGGCTASLG